MAPLLFISSGNVKSGAIMFSSARISCIGMRFLAVSEAAMYSASSIDRDTLVCLTDHQYSSLSAVFMQDPVVDLQSPISPAQLVSVKATSFGLSELLKRMP